MFNIPLFRSHNHRILCAAFLFTAINFYSGSLFGPQWITQDNAGLDEPLIFEEDTVQTTATIRRKEVREVLNGAPTEAFQDNLRPDVQYITAWPGSGFTNDVMQHINLIYLSVLTQRVPIIPFFVPTHVSYADGITGDDAIDVPVIDFGDVFDVPRLQRDLGKPVLEWWQVKDRNSTSVDPLGCWNIWQAVSTAHKEPHYTEVPQRLKLDISYTVAPSWVKLLPDDPTEPHMTFTSLMALSFPEQRRMNLATPAPSPLLQASLPPDEQLVCFDSMYWIAHFEPHEMWHDHSAAWRLVGQHLRWHPRIEDLAQQHVRRAFALAPYITIHARRGDFGNYCAGVPLAECFAPLSAFARRVDEVKAELLQTKGLVVERVILTSDERDPVWWDAAAAYGYARIKYGDATAEAEARGEQGQEKEAKAKYREWYPLFVDAAVQSGGVGLAGTEFSTVSKIAGHRVRAWHGGAARYVKWGKVGADDH
ncbi:hypothetical protein DFH06DRAFT_1095752 [Mycena polygramma]|nr:hypothetical protein DFH06DRAFT_1095752 [Mycena polygramma]